MTRIVIVLIVIACIGLAVTNPGEAVHKRAVYDKLSNGMGISGFLGEVAGGMLGNLDAIPLTYNNYFLFSTTTFRDDVVSVGFFKYVRTTNWDGTKNDMRVVEQLREDRLR